MQLTKNFSLSEFECKCGCEMPSNILQNVKELSYHLQRLRDKYETFTHVDIRGNIARW